MRTSRLVSTLLLLQSRGRMTADALAAELDVSVRTVHRDIGALQQSGVPIFAESGHNGGFELVGGYTTRLTGMTRDEVEAMFLMGLPEAAADLGLADAASTARLEIESGLPAALRPGPDRLRGRFCWTRRAGSGSRTRCPTSAPLRRRCGWGGSSTSSISGGRSRPR
jgi:predicted DNA-binding transcriptional regulator YafY